MLIFSRGTDGCATALRIAQNIIQRVDRENLRFASFEIPRIHIRIGIATGRCYEIGGLKQIDIIGSAADLAARLCAEVEPDSILIDEGTKSNSNWSADNFIPCTRRLSLKNVPLPTNKRRREVFYTLKTERIF